MAIFKPAAKTSSFNNYGERQVFKALSQLNDDYTVIYAYDWLTKKPMSNVQGMGEIDFVVFHPYKGILVIEVKAGKMELNSDGSWQQYNQKSGTSKAINPFDQARKSTFELKEKFKDSGVKNPLINYCVWFVNYEKNDDDRYPAYIVDEILLDTNCLKEPEKALDKAYDYWSQKHTNKKVSTFKYRDKEQKKKLESNLNSAIKVLYPSMRFVQCLKSMINEKEEHFIQLSKEQELILSVMDNKKFALFEGVAGGGKTVMASMKAKMLSDRGEKVLFLCFNSELKKDLSLSLREYPYVEVHNVYTLGTKLTGRNFMNDGIENFYKLLEEYDAAQWPYKHVIIDEAQDIDDSVLDPLYYFTNELEGKFYMFYDGNQLVHKNNFGQWIEAIKEEPYRLVKNYRNTNQIFTTACSFIDMNDKYIASDESLEGVKPNLTYYADQEVFNEQLSRFVAHAIEQGGIEPEQLVILTATLPKYSVLDVELKVLGKYKISEKREKGKILFTTIRKFKGLEADAVLIIDIKEHSLEDKEYKDLLYVASSRAKHLLQLSIEELQPISVAKKNKIKLQFQLAEAAN